MKLINFCLKNKIIIIGFFLGAISFLLIYGPKTLIPTNTDWLMNFGDLTQHFLGWAFFRNDQWFLPLGKTISYGYPFGISITYTDSIPLLALIFKLFNPLLPKNFQYFGMWEFLCFALQGVFATLILRLYTKNNFLISIGALFFVFSPIMIIRVCGHNALSGHWIVLYAIYLLLFSLKKNEKINILQWITVSVLSVLIHPYFTLMVLVIYLGYEINDFIKHRLLINNVKKISIVISSVIITSVIVGLFYNDASVEMSGLGFFSMNLNALINPMGWSKYFLKDLTLATHGQYEGFNYLGFGMIILLIGALFINIKKIIINTDRINKQILLKWIGVIFIIIFLLFFSLSNQITLFSRTLINLPLPDSILKIWSMFRSTGRTFWPVYYLIYIYLFVQLIDFFKGKRLEYGLFTLLLLIFILQVADMRHMLFEQKNLFSIERIYDNPLKSDFWGDVAKVYKHIIMLPPYLTQNPESYKDFYNNFAHYAAKNRMTINAGYFARGPYKKIEEYAHEKIKLLKSGKTSSDEIYIIKDPKLFEELKLVLNESANVFLVDNFMVISNKNKLIKENYSGNFKRIKN